MSKKNTRALFQSPLNWSNATLSTDNMRVAKLTDSERKQLRVIIPQTITDSGDETEVIEEDENAVVQLLPVPFSRMTTLRLPDIHGLPDLIPQRGPNDASIWDDLEMGETVTPQVSRDDGSLGLSDIDTDYINSEEISFPFDDLTTPIRRSRPLVLPNDSDSDEDIDGLTMAVTKKRKGNEQQLTTSAQATKGQGRLVQRYIFTWNNPTITGEEFRDYMEASNAFRCVVFQKELGENGTPHFQGYVELEKRTYVSGVHKLVAPYKMSWQYANGNKAQNLKYCTKEDGRTDGPWYINEEIFALKGQGKRSDMDRFAALVLDNNGITEDVVDEMPGHCVQFGKNAQYLVNTLALQRAEAAERIYWVEQAMLEDNGLPTQGQKQRHLELYFGPTAVGKTTKIKMDVIGRREERLYTKNCAHKWWCGYDKHPVVLMDEFRGDGFGKMEDFNNITNMGAGQIETKGAQTVLLAREMHFATNRHPSHWWKKGGPTGAYYGWSDPRFQAVVRRFAKVHWWNDNKELTVLVNPGQQDDGEPDWAERNLAWRKFWIWNNRPAVEGDSVDLAALPGYFSLP